MPWLPKSLHILASGQWSRSYCLVSAEEPLFVWQQFEQTRMYLILWWKFCLGATSMLIRKLQTWDTGRLSVRGGWYQDSSKTTSLISTSAHWANSGGMTGWPLYWDTVQLKGVRWWTLIYCNIICYWLDQWLDPPALLSPSPLTETAKSILCNRILFRISCRLDHYIQCFLELFQAFDLVFNSPAVASSAFHSLDDREYLAHIFCSGLTWRFSRGMFILIFITSLMIQVSSFHPRVLSNRDMRYIVCILEMKTFDISYYFFVAVVSVIHHIRMKTI